MQITFLAPARIGAGALVVGALEGGGLTASAAKADRESGGALSRAMRVSRFSGKPGQLLEVLAPAGMAASRLILVGLGKAGGFDPRRAERIGADVVGRLVASGEEQVNFLIDLPRGAKLKPAALAAHLAMGARLRGYAFDIYKSKTRDDNGRTLKRVAIATGSAEPAKRAWTALGAVAEGVCLARDLVNEPANVLTPQEFASRARALSKLGVKVAVLTPGEMKKLGMNALLGVGQGSANESRLVVMEWRRGGKAQPVAFVGKGVCFDSGGLSLKSGQAMMGMKGDMGGAAAVTGAMHALARRKAKVNAVGIIGLVENMPDGKAQRPNDIVRSMSGQTIEILNTDAEGRLVLADCLWYAQKKFEPKIVVDLATLTGAIITSLGHEHAGLFSNDDALAKKLVAAGLAEGETVWRLPLGPAYDKLIKSKIADMKNIGGPAAGSITAAQFLQRFVDKTPWAHLDIAGVAWQDGETKPLAPTWGTGWGVRILDRLVADYYEK